MGQSTHIPWKKVGSGGTGSGSATIPSDLFFASTSDRDSFFAANPARLKEGIICGVGDPVTVWQYTSGAWKSVQTAFTGPRGPAGLPGAAGAPGADGREVRLQKSATHIQWQYLSDSSWTNLVPLADLKGVDGVNGLDGDPVTIRKNATHVQWKYASEAATAWRDIIPLADLKGAKGDDGTDGVDGTDGDPGESPMLQIGMSPVSSSDPTPEKSIQWKLPSDSAWTKLIGTEELVGPWKPVFVVSKFPYGGTTGPDFILWKYSSEANTAYRTLLDLSTITGTIPEAPQDGALYGRRNAAWEAVGAAAAKHVHNQSSPSADWNITHALATQAPSVLVISSAGEQVVGEVQYSTATNTNIHILFTEAVSGTAILS